MRWLLVREGLEALQGQVDHPEAVLLLVPSYHLMALGAEVRALEMALPVDTLLDTADVELEAADVEAEDIQRALASYPILNMEI
jgi:hypothetical protein